MWVEYACCFASAARVRSRTLDAARRIPKLPLIVGCVGTGMDIIGGAGISRGPMNFLASVYINTPVCITVEGANALTRSLIIYGQVL